MIGNDIVDLAYSRQQSNWQRKGWIDKIFTTDEQLQIRASTQPERLVWLMWSMKESAYKIYNRMTRERSYSPKKFVCRVVTISDTAATGYVLCLERCFSTKSVLTTGFLHTVASSTADFDVINISIKKRAKDCRFLRRSFSLLKDQTGIPYLLDPMTGNKLTVSLSHHGSYEAIIFVRE
ncbi:MAG TPA: 4'-phosphopantetheinyl transferase superfamily protein [Arachidicoccus sp.]|nr:4'-phosphopantetheinyl transferase superfamily protein [Arachidicoccus sp.]